MKVEDRQALRFILQDDIYLLDEDKLNYPIPNSPDRAAPQPEIKTPKPVFNYLGANKKCFLILTSYANDDFISPEHLRALESVLSRKGYSMEDVAIFNVANNAFDYDDLIAHFRPQRLLILGQESVPAADGTFKFNQAEMRGEMTVLCTFSFEQMMSSPDNKKTFWEQVKSL